MNRFGIFYVCVFELLVLLLLPGIGVPILLAYVYGVVPISLCRSGGCGVTTSSKGGVRFEFDEDNETNGAGGGAYSGISSFQTFGFTRIVHS